MFITMRINHEFLVEECKPVCIKSQAGGTKHLENVLLVAKLVDVGNEVVFHKADVEICNDPNELQNL